MKIVGVGSYIPEKRESNYEKAYNFGYEDSFVNEKVGFEKLAIKMTEETISDMCINAFSDLRNKLNIDTNNIDLITVVTQNSSNRIPHESAILHNKLSLKKNCMSFDISQGCSGYVHALTITESIMQNMGYKDALIFTCDPYRDIINPNDKNVSMIFGDAATVSYVSKRDVVGYSLQASSFGTLPNSNSCLTLEDGYLHMDGRKVFNYAYKEVPYNIKDLLKSNNLSITEIDRFILHQGTKYIVDAIAKSLRIESEKVDFFSENYGNTISSSIPLILARYFEKVEQRVVLSGFGVGFTWGSCILKYES